MGDVDLLKRLIGERIGREVVIEAQLELRRWSFFKPSFLARISHQAEPVNMDGGCFERVRRRLACQQHNTLSYSVFGTSWLRISVDPP